MNEWVSEGKWCYSRSGNDDGEEDKASLEVVLVRVSDNDDDDDHIYHDNGETTR